MPRVAAGAPVSVARSATQPRNWRRSLVFNGFMKRSILAFAVAVLTAGGLPSGASAQAIELGQTSTGLVAPVCPKGVSQANCTIVLTQVTALETLRDGSAYPTTVKKAGEVVAFTLGLSALSTDKATVKQDISFLNSSYGGVTEAALTVLRPLGPRKSFQWGVAAESPVYHLQRYLGQVVEFPLAQPLPVVPGETIALSVPTWAPVLSFDLAPKSFAYRQSRKANCTHPASALQAQLTIGASATYKCDYPGTRVEYTATEITTPTPNPGS
jgi:hypothetical protein